MKKGTSNTFDIINLNPVEAKVHLAVTPNSGDDPLKRFFDGSFEEFQAYQTRKNFSRMSSPQVLCHS